MKTFKVATYNIHKGVQGLGPARRLEIHNLRYAVGQLDADLVCLQEVQAFNHLQARRFKHWPQQEQADFLAPEDCTSVYCTNAVTQHGEHGNALLSRWPVVAHQHADVSDHRLEQRGLLHVNVVVQGRVLHVIVVHLGLLQGSRIRQIQKLHDFMDRHVPIEAPLLVAGDFNDWGCAVSRLMASAGLHTNAPGRSHLTYPSRLPLVQLDHVYARGVHRVNTDVPRGRIWGNMSDHLPLLVEFAWDVS